MTVRTRFAPSPTGYLHIGGARTALFSWIYARKLGGQFILRIEDTDRERSTQASIDAILEAMAWLELGYDEGPFYQTQRFDRYRDVVEDWISQGLAYRCDCTPERLETVRAEQMLRKEKPKYDGHCRERQLPANTKGVIRFKTPLEGSVSFNDEVKGLIQFENQELDDLVLVRTDGVPTYNFAVVVDDVDMQITHVIRGDDHVNNTPRQIHLFHALKAMVPVFAHVPMILGSDGKRLSKRHGAVSVMQYREEGYLPEALLNYLIRLGWSHGNEEIFSIEDMIKSFDLSSISRSPANFNPEKLQWLNQHYLKTAPRERTLSAFRWQLEQEGIQKKESELEALFALHVDRCKTLVEMRDRVRPFLTEFEDYDDAAKEQLKTVDLKALEALMKGLHTLSEWTAESIHPVLPGVLETFQLKMGQLAPALRAAVLGTTHSPSIDQTLFLLGQARTLKRIDVALKWVLLQK